ncbi:MAG: cysteine--tRNA ligase [candidate division WOR-3 bacterium]|jgi:cysteinyl-tRNA synthetase|nr:cysteine--tRNA ligase [candidate division WOR-3 bacterium]MDH7518922.1 cysteine--tRNA ligase [bacterium]
MKVYNTLTRRKEDFVPVEPGKVKIYTCGPTVYWFAHTGNFRAYIFADTLRRVFEYLGYEVRHVMNITDVGHLTTDDDLGEDKLEAGAKREGKTPKEIARFYEAAFFRDAAKLNILRPHIVCRATEHINEMIDLIKRIEQNGFTYKTQVGLIFDTGKYPDYWRLGRLNLDEQRAGARVEIDPGRKNPSDFALWITNQPKHLMQWDSPWGRGFPGWHIECSAMSMKYLGEEFDIHTGGIDHIPIHHTNERAQNFAATGKEVVHYWMHNAFLQIGEARMGKSEGNIVTIPELEAQGFEPLAFRYLCLTAHYRMPLNFTSEALSAAQNGLRGLRELGRNAQFWQEGKEGDWLERAKAEFKAAIQDDLNLPQALAVVWNLVREGNRRQDRRAWQTLLDFDQVLGLRLGETNEEETIPADIYQLAVERDRARKAKDWVRADQLRNEIKNRGWIVEDTLTGWRLKRA